MAAHHLAAIWITGVVAAAGCSRQEPSVPGTAPTASPTGRVERPAAPEAMPSGNAGGSQAPATVETPRSDAATETAGGPTLGIGSPAPPLALASWVKGKPVESFAPDQVYVIEFWATWCGPCRTSMPHLSELQTTLGDSVQFVGITAETEETVQNFLNGPYQSRGSSEASDKTWNDVVQYALALDDDRRTNDAYMEAAGRNGIPCAFIVGRDGIIEWIGHPMTMDEPLEKVRTGAWDRELAKARFDEERKIQVAMRTAQSRLRDSVNAKDWNAAAKTMEDLISQFPDNPQLKFSQLNFLALAGRNDEVATKIEELLKENWDDADLLNTLAWGIATKQLTASLDSAFKAAQRSVELTKETNASYLDTLARVCFEQGNVDQALDWQRKAVAIDGNTPEIAAALSRYEDAKSGAASTTETIEPNP